MKSGDTIFAVRDAEVRGAEWFVPASLAAEVRREALSALDERAGTGRWNTASCPKIRRRGILRSG